MNNDKKCAGCGVLLQDQNVLQEGYTTSLDNDICQYDKFSYEVVDPKDNMDIFLRNYMWDKIFKLDF